MQPHIHYLLQLFAGAAKQSFEASIPWINSVTRLYQPQKTWFVWPLINVKMLYLFKEEHILPLTDEK